MANPTEETQKLVLAAVTTPALPTGGATAANQTNGNQKAQVVEQGLAYSSGGTTTGTGQLAPAETTPGYISIGLDPNAGGGTGTITFGKSGATSTTLWAGQWRTMRYTDPSTVYITNGNGYTVTWCVER